MENFCHVSNTNYRYPKNPPKLHYERANQMSLPPTRYDFFQYYNFLNDGPLRKDMSKKVIILGAGISGTVTAKLLQQMGQRVKIFEASNRVGGRIHTYRDPSGWKGELGALQIPVTHIFALSIMSNFSIKVSSFRRIVNNNLIALNGRIKRYKAALREKNPFSYVFDKPETNSTIAENMQIFQEQIMDDIESRTWMDALEYFDKFSLEDYCRKKCKFSNELTKNILYLSYFYEMRSISMYEFVLMMFTYGAAPAKLVNSGLDNLPKSVASSLKNNTIQFNSTVVKVSTKKDYACVYYKINGQSKLEKECSDYVVVATSLGALRVLKFQPKLTSLKREAIDKMHFETGTRVVEIFSKPFWESFGVKEGDIITDWDTGPMNVPGKYSGRNVFYGALGEGDKARELANMSDSQIIEGHITQLSNMFKMDVKSLYKNAVVKKWSKDPFSRGGFSMCLPGQCTNHFRKSFQETHGRIHFAGEQTSDFHGWIEGAIESAIRVSIEISKDLDEKN
ncbi:DgyrCDS3455 [Dimorphilus gyrociliatus]|uniref:Amine oxidase n=1 Tax=Dimorphilus gyrociliatus TaxID=2664684 RepID=A0A7I8VGC1_9ANNE|nr:DgyrCDS3455 [Dimorphilus gyrociliatus]